MPHPGRLCPLTPRPHRRDDPDAQGDSQDPISVRKLADHIAEYILNRGAEVQLFNQDKLIGAIVVLDQAVGSGGFIPGRLLLRAAKAHHHFVGIEGAGGDGHRFLAGDGSG